MGTKERQSGLLLAKSKVRAFLDSCDCDGKPGEAFGAASCLK